RGGRGACAGRYLASVGRQSAAIPPRRRIAAGLSWSVGRRQRRSLLTPTDGDRLPVDAHRLRPALAAGKRYWRQVKLLMMVRTNHEEVVRVVGPTLAHGFQVVALGIVVAVDLLEREP